MKFIVEMTYDKRYPSNISHSKSGCGVGGGGYPTIRLVPKNDQKRLWNTVIQKGAALLNSLPSFSI